MFWNIFYFFVLSKLRRNIHEKVCKIGHWFFSVILHVLQSRNLNLQEAGIWIIHVTLQETLPRRAPARLWAWPGARGQEAGVVHPSPSRVPPALGEGRQVQGELSFYFTAFSFWILFSCDGKTVVGLRNRNEFHTFDVKRLEINNDNSSPQYRLKQ